MPEKRNDPNTGSTPMMTEGPSNWRRISWAAIFAGAVAALSIQILLTLLGMAIGLWTLPAVGPEFVQEVGIGGAIWAIVTFIIALYCGGWIAGRMSGLKSKFDGLLEGFMVWGVVTVATVMLLTTAVGGIVGGAAGMVGEVLAVGPEELEDPEEMIEEYGEPAREALEEAEVPEEQMEDAATAGAAASFGAFISLLLGALAAAFAGRQGSLSGLREATRGPGGPPKAEVKE